MKEIEITDEDKKNEIVKRLTSDDAVNCCKCYIMPEILINKHSHIFIQCPKCFRGSVLRLIITPESLDEPIKDFIKEWNFHNS